MKTETKKRLLGGYFKNTSYNFQGGTPIDDYYNEKYGSGQSHIQEGGVVGECQDGTKNNALYCSEEGYPCYDSEEHKCYDTAKLFHSKITPISDREDTNILSPPQLSPESEPSVQLPSVQLPSVQLPSVSSPPPPPPPPPPESEQTYDEEPPPLENIPISELQPAQERVSSEKVKELVKNTLTDISNTIGLTYTYANKISEKLKLQAKSSWFNISKKLQNILYKAIESAEKSNELIEIYKRIIEVVENFEANINKNTEEIITKISETIVLAVKLLNKITLKILQIIDNNDENELENITNITNNIIEYGNNVENFVNLVINNKDYTSEEILQSVIKLLNINTDEMQELLNLEPIPEAPTLPSKSVSTEQLTQNLKSNCPEGTVTNYDKCEPPNICWDNKNQKCMSPPKAIPEAPALPKKDEKEYTQVTTDPFELGKPKGILKQTTDTLDNTDNTDEQIVQKIDSIDFSDLDSKKSSIQSRLNSIKSEKDKNDVYMRISDLTREYNNIKSKLDNIGSLLKKYPNEENKLLLNDKYLELSQYNNDIKYFKDALNRIRVDNRNNRNNYGNNNRRDNRNNYGNRDRNNYGNRDRDNRGNNRGDDKLRQELQRYNNRGDEINKLNRKVDDEGKRLQGLERPNIEGKREGIRPQGMPGQMPNQPGQRPQGMPGQRPQGPQGMPGQRPQGPQGMPIQPGQIPIRPGMPGQQQPGQRPQQGMPGQQQPGQRPEQKDKKEYVFKKRRPEDLLISDSDSDSETSDETETDTYSDTETDTYSDTETSSSDDESVVDVPDVPINKYMLNDLMHILKDIGRNDRNRFLNILNNDYLYNPRLERYMMKAPENVYNRYNLFIEHLHENTNNDGERREMIGLIKGRNDKLNHRTFKR